MSSSEDDDSVVEMGPASEFQGQRIIELSGLQLALQQATCCQSSYLVLGKVGGTRTSFVIVHVCI